jgi:fatty acid desaturase
MFGCERRERRARYLWILTFAALGAWVVGDLNGAMAGLWIMGW